MRVCLLLLVTTACAPAPVITSCDYVCAELVSTCAYAAFPTLDTCRQGCAYWEEEGVDVDSYLTCVQDAECNTFQIVECEHDLGISSVP